MRTNWSRRYLWLHCCGWILNPCKSVKTRSWRSDQRTGAFRFKRQRRRRISHRKKMEAGKKCRGSGKNCDLQCRRRRSRRIYGQNHLGKQPASGDRRHGRLCLCCRRSKRHGICQIGISPGCQTRHKGHPTGRRTGAFGKRNIGQHLWFKNWCVSRIRGFCLRRRNSTDSIRWRVSRHAPASAAVSGSKRSMEQADGDQ